MSFLKIISDSGNLNKKEIIGIGIGCPGAIDSVNGNIDYSNNLNWNDVPRSQNENPIKVLLVARSTVTNPIQELWTQKNYSKIKENNFIS